MAATATTSTAPKGPPWLERGDALIVPRRPSRTDHVRIVLAIIAAAGTVAFAVAGHMNPAWVGMEHNVALFYITAPALVLAGIFQVYLIVTGAHRPHAVFSPAGVQIHGYYFPSKEITRVWVQRSPVDGSAALMIGTTREDPGPAVCAVPPGLLSDDDLNALFGKVKEQRAAAKAAGRGSDK